MNGKKEQRSSEEGRKELWKRWIDGGAEGRKEREAEELLKVS